MRREPRTPKRLRPETGTRRTVPRLRGETAGAQSPVGNRDTRASARPSLSRDRRPGARTGGRVYERPASRSVSSADAGRERGPRNINKFKREPSAAERAQQRRAQIEQGNRLEAQRQHLQSQIKGLEAAVAQAGARRDRLRYDMQRTRSSDQRSRMQESIDLKTAVIAAKERSIQLLNQQLQRLN